MSDSVAEVKKHVRVYMTVFGSLALLTVITVAASYVHFQTSITITIALFIATLKAGLVASYFMHLISEKKLIYNILIITAVFFFAMMFLVLTAYLDRLT